MYKSDYIECRISNKVIFAERRVEGGTLDAVKQELFESLLATRSTEHTGGRKLK